jgi:hypothetical protein
MRSMKYWEMIADNLSKAGWSWGCVSRVRFQWANDRRADANSGENRERTRASGNDTLVP